MRLFIYRRRYSRADLAVKDRQRGGVWLCMVTQGRKKEERVREGRRKQGKNVYLDMHCPIMQSFVTVPNLN